MPRGGPKKVVDVKYPLCLIMCILHVMKLGILQAMGQHISTEDQEFDTKLRYIVISAAFSAQCNIFFAHQKFQCPCNGAPKTETVHGSLVGVF